MKRIKDLFLFGLLSISVFSSCRKVEISDMGPDIVLWSKTFGGMKNDGGYSLKETSDGFLIIVGYTYSFGNGDSDVYLAKTNQNGDTVWTRHYGGEKDDWGSNIQLTSDGGFIIFGKTKSFGDENGDMYLIKTNGNGDVQWENKFGGKGIESCYSGIQTSDGGYIAVGWVDLPQKEEADVYVVKVDRKGDLVWERRYGWRYKDYGLSILRIDKDKFVIVGKRGVGDKWWKRDIYVFTIDDKGNASNVKRIGRRFGDEGWDIQKTSDGGYVIVGTSQSLEDQYNNVFLVKTDANFDTVWTKAYGWKRGKVGSSEAFYGRSVKETADKGYIIAGYKTVYPIVSDFNQLLIIKTDSLGNPQIIKSYGKERRNDKGFEIIKTSDGNFVVVGFTRSFGAMEPDVYLMKLKPFSSKN